MGSLQHRPLGGPCCANITHDVITPDCESFNQSSDSSFPCCLQEQATTLHVMGMLDYAQLKGRLLSTTAGLVLAGSCIAFSSGGAGAAAPFAVGGSAGMAYLWLLQQSVDSLPGTMPATSASRFDKVSAAGALHWRQCVP